MLGMVSQDDGIGLMSVTETLDSKIKAQEEKLKQLKGRQYWQENVPKRKNRHERTISDARF